MSKFQEGQYVKPRIEGVGPIYRVYGYSGERIVLIEKFVEGARFTGKAHEDALCLALNIDYINTLTLEQKAKFILTLSQGDGDCCAWFGSKDHNDRCLFSNCEKCIKLGLEAP